MNTLTETHSSRLLQTWGDALIAHQRQDGEDRGGLYCSACERVHGRCGDAVYPLLALFARTGDEKYRRAAFEVFDWSERRVRREHEAFEPALGVQLLRERGIGAVQRVVQGGLKRVLLVEREQYRANDFERDGKAHQV